MNDQPAPDGLTQASTRRRRRVPLVWLVPIVSLMIGAWLAWDTYAKRGPDHYHNVSERRGPAGRAVPSEIQRRRHGRGEGHRCITDLSNVIVTVETTRQAPRC